MTPDKPEPKAPRRIWIVRRFGGVLWSSHIFCSENAAINQVERLREQGGDGYILGPYALKKRST